MMLFLTHLPIIQQQLLTVLLVLSLPFGFPLQWQLFMLAFFIVEFLTLCFVFNIKSVLQGTKLFFALLVGNYISGLLLPFIYYPLFVSALNIPREAFFLMVSFCYFMSIGIITLTKSGIITLTLKKALNQFIGWLFIINGVSFAISTISASNTFYGGSLFFSIRPEILAPLFRLTLPIGLIAAMVKLSIIIVGLRKIMSTRTILIILLMSFVSLLFSSFLQGMLLLFTLPGVVVIYPFVEGVVGWILLIVIYPLLEGVVGWIFLKGRLSFRKFRELILLLVAASVVGKISVIIGVYALKVFFKI